MFGFTKVTPGVLVATISVTQVCYYFIDFSVSRTDGQLAKFIWSYEDKVFRGDERPAPDEQPHITNSSVRAVYNQPFATFTTNFVLNLRSSSSMQLPSAATDGIAFILAADPSPPMASQGMWLRIVNASTNGKVEAKILAIEFDTKKSFPDDVDDNHVGLDLNSIHSLLQQPLMEFGVNLSAIGDVFVKVNCDGINISIYVSLSARLDDLSRKQVIFHHLNLSFLPGDVDVGFSSPKFDRNDALHGRIKSWQFYGTDVGDKSHGQHFWIWIMVVVIIMFLCGVVLLFL